MSNYEQLITIIGAGIGGCALALALQRRGIYVKIYEKDGSFNMRHQGYGLTMQQAGSSLDQLGLVPEGVSSNSHYVFTTDGHIIRAHFGRLTSHLAKENKDISDRRRFNLHIPRQILRQRLMERLLPGTIEWNHKLISFIEDKEEVKLEFDNGSLVSSSLLVGADGIRSALRQSIINDPLIFLGHIVILGIAPCSHPLVRRRIFQTVNGITRWYCMPFTVSGDGVDLSLECGDSKDTTMWQLSWACEEEEAKRLGSDPALLLAAAKERVGTWHDPIPLLLDSTPLHLVSGYPVYDRQLLSMKTLHGDIIAGEDNEDETSHSADIVRSYNRVTILGDAAHPMSPFKGQGANQALMDALSLAKEIGKVKEFSHLDGRELRSISPLKKFKAPPRRKRHSPSSTSPHTPPVEATLASALTAFEMEMIKRANTKVIGSRDAVSFLHSNAVLSCDTLKSACQRENDVTLIDELRKRGVNAVNSFKDLDESVARVVSDIGNLERVECKDDDK